MTIETNLNVPKESDDAGRAEARSSRRVGTSRAMELLQQLIHRRLFTADALSLSLGIPHQRLLTYLVGKTRMPLESQRRLADLIVNQAPELAREARRLRLQCEAEELFRARVTKTHMVAPSRRFR